MQLTDYHARYYAWELTRLRRGGNVDRIAQSLFDASVDLNPHQIDAALFAIQNPLSKGVMLADEVGLGKTIEAALVLSQYWAERRRRLLVICPASLRKQWAQELAEKFHLPSQILDARTWQQLRSGGVYNPFDQDTISIISIHYAVRMEKELRQIPWDVAVIDEAHKLRNAHRDSHRSGQSLKRSLAGVRKVLLTATPLQNSLLEVYGLSTLIDPLLFGDAVSFRSQFMRGEGDITGLRHRLRDFSQRTLRRQVLEYVQYTERKPITVPFEPSKEEQRLYDLVSGYLQREGSYGIPSRQRHLVGLILRKLLASSTSAVLATLQAILARLEKLESAQETDDSWFQRFVADQDLEEEYLEALEEEDDNEPAAPAIPVDRERLRGEIAEIEQFIQIARHIHEDAKSHALLSALNIGFTAMAENGAARKAVVFTESRRTQDYLVRFLQAHGHAGKVVAFSGTNNSPEVSGLYQRWLKAHAGSDRITGSAAVDRRTAIIDYFREEGEIMVATEAAAEGVNLQFCSLVVNYDLPWNPQRVEQRIGRCHRYGQKHDVVVINFLNQYNAADRRVLELLSEKLHLFDGVFGASDEVLGRIESGVDFERRIAAIYDSCRTTEQIDAAFQSLRAELEDSISRRMQETEQKLLENFDARIHELLRIRRQKAEENLDRIGQLFWRLSRYILQLRADFDDPRLEFTLKDPPRPNIPQGRYRLIRKGEQAPENAHLYRLRHPLGEFVLEAGRQLETPPVKLRFQLSKHGPKISVLEQLQSRQGWLSLQVLELQSFAVEEHLVFTAVSDAGELLDQEACERLFQLDAELGSAKADAVPEDFLAIAERQVQAALSCALDENDVYFQREREKLDQWADDQIHSAEQQLEDTRTRIKDAKRRARTAQTPAEQKQAQQELKKLERQQRVQRQNIFEMEDQIEARRDKLIEALEQRLNQKSLVHPLFKLRWELA